MKNNNTIRLRVEIQKERFFAIKVFDVLSLSNYFILVCSFICHLISIRVCLSMGVGIFDSCSISTFVTTKFLKL